MNPTAMAARPSSSRTKHSELVLLSGPALRRIMEPRQSIEALREAYRALADHRDDRGQSLAFPIGDGSIHVKAGLLPGSREAFAAKVNVNIPGNEARHGRPTIQGVVILADARDGQPLAVMESMALTAIRTAAATALAATFGARPGATRAAIIGCGVQAGYQLEALAACFPLREVRVFDIDAAKAAAFARTASTGTLSCRSVATVVEAVEGAEICVTCTTSKAPVLTGPMALDGCFVAAVGADNPEKHEVDPALMRRARILVDDLDACASGGDLAHALRSGLVSRTDVHADLADLAAGRKSGRETDSELVIFDSTGSGVQDVALAWAAYRASLAAAVGDRFALNRA
ncbi:MAG TPA: ornithine cyclodeaminase family protein [Ramlibacter sp.]|nr:ornithine cyclodeaminase family protein [Ramlibacter sp.]